MLVSLLVYYSTFKLEEYVSTKDPQAFTTLQDFLTCHKIFLIK
jgi:hypothetical protein